MTYEGYLATDALTLAPDLSWATSSGGVTAGGALTRFASGHLSGTADGAGQWVVARQGRTVLQLLGDVSFAKYQFGPGVVRDRLGARVTVGLQSLQLWGNAFAGTAAQSTVANGLAELDAGFRVPIPHGAILGSAAQHWLGSREFTDAEAAAQLVAGRLTATVNGGVRAGYTLTGRHQWAHADLVFGALAHVAVTAGAGTYPRDPTENTPGVRYVAIGLRVVFPRTTRPLPPSPLLVLPRANTFDSASGPASSSGTRRPEEAPRPLVSVGVGQPGRVTLRVGPVNATSVEVAGDFTQWSPVAMTRLPDGVWIVRVAITPGLHRFNVRVDHGPWMTPAGVTHGADDFGGETGQFVAP